MPKLPSPTKHSLCRHARFHLTWEEVMRNKQNKSCGGDWRIELLSQGRFLTIEVFLSYLCRSKVLNNRQRSDTDY